jgi:hypothetical protein
MAALPDLITVAQYRQLPDDGGTVYELHHGEAIVLSRRSVASETLALATLETLGGTSGTPITSVRCASGRL